MKTEYSVFLQYSTELANTGVISRSDLRRIRRSLAAKGAGFVNDMTALAQDIRSGLSTYGFRLSAHTNRVFAREPRSVLPSFLGLALSRVFSSDGQLLQDYCRRTAADLLIFLDALKRTEPSKNMRPLLQDKLWTSLKENFQDETRVLTHIEIRLEDPQFRSLVAHARRRFQAYMDFPSPCEAPEVWDARFGPGKNLDRIHSNVSSDWSNPDYLATRNPYSRVPKILNEIHDHVLVMWSRSPFSCGGLNYQRVSRFEPIVHMRCSAQPKSFKALRGVGVTNAFTMSMQLAWASAFYATSLDEHLPLLRPDDMVDNLRDNWSSLSVLDLSSASDRLYWSVLSMFGTGAPRFEEAYAMRVMTLQLPKEQIPCASPVMGAGTTFPVMSAFFASVALAVCDEKGYGHELVRVYGDDIQTPHYEETIKFLIDLGSRPSRAKSYDLHSAFKESCEGHFVERDGILTQCRPAFIPSMGRTPNPTDAYRLLVLSKDSFFRSSALSKSVCDYIERTYWKLGKLPMCTVASPRLGRPTLSRSSHLVLDLVNKVGETVERTLRGAIRLSLRTDTPLDQKVYKKHSYRQQLMEIKDMRIRDELHKLNEAVVLGAFFTYLKDTGETCPGLQGLDLYSHAYQRVPVKYVHEFVARIMTSLS